MRKLLSSLAVVSLFGLCASSAALANTQIIIQNNNGPGEGFNDPTPATPVGGNPGTTVGQQRLIAFEYAASIWGATVKSPTPIVIQAQFTPLPCESDSAVLGQAAPAGQYSDPSWPQPNVWYASALANVFAGKDLSPNGPEITADFNSSLGSKGCLDGYGWYYGLDGNAPDNSTQLAVVLLHEFAHGLGFLTFEDATSGQNFQGQPDIWEYFTYDDDIGKFWSDMTPDERKTSAVDPFRVVWSGGRVVTTAPGILKNALGFAVTAPANIAGVKLFAGAEFGGIIPYSDAGISGNLTLVQDDSPNPDGGIHLACGPVGSLNGAIAAVNRGSCNFTDKVKNIQNAGGTLALVLDNTFLPDGGDELIGMAGTDPSITIPAFILDTNGSIEVRNELDAGTIVGVSLNFDPVNGLAGADGDGGVYLYTPAALSLGSSVSHFSLAAYPPLLMEPYIHPDTPQGLDLTKPFMEDIGWKVEGDHALALTKLDLPTLTPGATARYLFSVVNHVSTPLLNVSVDVPSPSGLTLKSVAGSCTQLPCDLGTVNGQSNKSFVVTYDVPVDFPSTDPVVETGSATSSSFTAGPDDTASFSSKVENEADLTLKMNGPTSADSDAKVSYDLTISNQGPSNAPNTAVAVISSYGVKLDGFSGDCSGPTCTLGTMAPGAVKHVTASFTITGDSDTTATPTFKVTSDGFDPNTTDNLTSTNVKVAGGCSTTGGEAGVLPLGFLCLLLMGLRKRRSA